MTPGKQADGTRDPALASLIGAPCRVLRPAIQKVPFVFASPHSGRLYPPGFVARSWLSPLALRRSEDAFVDELFGCVVDQGAPMIAALFPRAYVDVNRAASELDNAMFEAELGLDVDAPSARVTAGLGVIPRIVRDGAEIYREKLSPREAEERLALLYRPYHTALAELVEETRARFGMAIVVDCHSMPSASNLPDIVFGDRYGASASPSVMHHAEHSFAACGFTTARNAPYAGGYTTHLYGRREQGVQALQIEVNRMLYLHEERIERGPRFAGTQARLARALEQLLALDTTALRIRPQAAE